MADLKILLITNDIHLINRYNKQVDIINSVILLPDAMDEYDYILLDEQNIKIEEDSIAILEKFKSKTAILGFNIYDGFTILPKEEFNPQTISIYFDEQIPKHLTTIEDDKSNIIDLYELIAFIDKLSDINIPIDDTLKELDKMKLNFKTNLYNHIPTSVKARISKEASWLYKLKLWKYIK